MEKATLIHNPVFKDARGTFAPIPVKFNKNQLGVLQKNWIQSNISYNPSKFTLRGLHYQSPPKGQGKLIRVIQGEVFDVAVDLRQSSPTFGKWVGEILSSDNKKTAK
jgi:dTDP-4-dehydrorhamnose 3,5-epimerase